MLVLGEPSRNRVLVEAKSFGGVAARSVHLPIVEAVVAQPSTQIDP
jgi:hypothetical protein